MSPQILAVVLARILYWPSRTMYEAVQKVRRPTQLTTRYAHHISSLFNIFSCNWNALGPAFLQSSDSVVEELFFLVLQPAICRADNVLVVRNFVSFQEFFQFRNKQKSLEARTTYLITRRRKHWLLSKMLALNYSVTHRVRRSYVYLSLIHIWRCRRIERCRSRWSPYH